MKLFIVISFILILNSCDYKKSYEVRISTQCGKNIQYFSNKIIAKDDHKATILMRDVYVKSLLMQEYSNCKISHSLFLDNKEILFPLERYELDSIITNAELHFGKIPEETKKIVYKQYIVD